MNDRMNESLSALMDGEADELEIRRLLNPESQQALFDKWHNYQLIGSILREEPATLIDLSKGIRQALDGEPMDDISLTTEPVANGKWRWLMASGTVAASVTMAILVGVQWQQTDMHGEGVQVAQSTEAPIQEMRAVATAPTQLSAEQQQQLKEAQLKLQEYVLQHNDDTSTSASQVMLPHARTVNFNQGVEIKR